MSAMAWTGLPIMVASQIATFLRIEPFWSWNTPIRLRRSRRRFSKGQGWWPCFTMYEFVRLVLRGGGRPIGV